MSYHRRPPFRPPSGMMGRDVRRAEEWVRQRNAARPPKPRPGYATTPESVRRGKRLAIASILSMLVGGVGVLVYVAMGGTGHYPGGGQPAWATLSSWLILIGFFGLCLAPATARGKRL